MRRFVEKDSSTKTAFRERGATSGEKLELNHNDLSSPSVCVCVFLQVYEEEDGQDFFENILKSFTLNQMMLHFLKHLKVVPGMSAEEVG